jgi:hypothetical protein
MSDLRRTSFKEFFIDRPVTLGADKDHTIPRLPSLIEESDKMIDLAIDARTGLRLAVFDGNLRPGVGTPNLVAYAHQLLRRDETLLDVF